MATRPTTLPEWATDADRTVEPSAGEKGTGWQAGYAPPARKMNWLDNNVYQWLAALRKAQVKSWQWANLSIDAAGMAGDPVNGTFAACGDDSIWASRDGVGWIKQVDFAGTDHDHYAMHFNGAIWASAGRSDLVSGHDAEVRYTSDEDPFGTWSTATVTASANDTALRGITYGPAGWVGVGDNAEIVFASGATPSTFARQTAAGAYAGDFQDVTYDATLGLYIAVGTGGMIQTSPDGTTWTVRTPDDSYTDVFLSAAADGSGTVVIVGENGMIQKSTDGTTWATQTGPEAIVAGSHFDDWTAVRFADDHFVVIAPSIVTGNGDVYVAYSEDGATWDLAPVALSPGAGLGMDEPSCLASNGVRWAIAGGPTSDDYLLLGPAIG